MSRYTRAPEAARLGLGSLLSLTRSHGNCWEARQRLASKHPTATLTPVRLQLQLAPQDRSHTLASALSAAASLSPPPSTCAPPDPPLALATMASEQQGLFLDMVSAFLVQFPRNAGRCDAVTALSLTAVAKNPRQCELSRWGWRAMHWCEKEEVRYLRAQSDRADARLQKVLDEYIDGIDPPRLSLVGRLWRAIEAALINRGLVLRLEEERPELRPLLNRWRPRLRSDLEVEVFLEEVESDLEELAESESDEG